MHSRCGRQSTLKVEREPSLARRVGGRYGSVAPPRWTSSALWTNSDELEIHGPCGRLLQLRAASNGSSSEWERQEHETDLHGTRCVGSILGFILGADAGERSGQARRQRVGRQLA